MNVETLNKFSEDKTLKMLYKWLYVFLFIYLLVYPHRIGIINNLWGKSIILFNWLIVIYIVFMSKNYNKVFISFFLIMGIVLSLIISTETVERNYLRQNLGSFLSMVLMIEAQKWIKVDESIVKYIARFNIAFCIIFFLYSYMPFAYRLETDAMYVAETALTLGYSNPNATAMMLLYCTAINLIADKCKVYSKPTFITMQLLLTFLIYQTTSRSSFLAMILLTAMSFVPLKKIPKMFLIGSIAIPISFISLLPYLKEQGFMKDTLLLGESIYTGREEIYVEAMGYLKTPLNWIFGDFSQGGFTNFHNSMLSLLITVGVLGVSLYILIWYKNIAPYMKSTNKVSAAAIYALFAILIQSSSEAAFLIGTIPYNIMVVTLFIFVRYKEEIENEITSP